MEKYLLVSSQDNPNIGVIRIEQNNCAGTAREIVAQLLDALQSHFDYTVIFHKVELISEHPITLRAVVKLDVEGEPIREFIDIDETWIY